jgi:hypothetical protein
MQFFRIIFALAAVFLLVSCQDASPDLVRSDETTVPDADIATSVDTQPIPLDTPDPSLSSMTGQVINKSIRGGEPLANIEVRLANVHWNEDQSEGAFVIDTASSPVTHTNHEGKFYFTNIEPGNYVVVVGDLYGKYVILANDDNSARVFTTARGEVLDVGILDVDIEAAPSFPTTPTPIMPYPSGEHSGETRDQESYP